MDSVRSKRLLFFAAIAPALFVFPALWAPIPHRFHGHREVAGYFQALAYWRDPLGQFFYNTPAENLSAIHLHSILSAPLVGLGYTRGGRVVSLLAAVAAAVVVGYLAATLVSSRVAPLAAAAVWAHPLFLNLAGGFMPETLSILLTSGALYLLLCGHRHDSAAMTVGAVLLLVPAISTHLWEASILLPLLVLAAVRRQWRVVAALPLIGGGTVAANWYLTNLQPSSPRSLVRRYVLWQDPSVLLSTQRFWFETATSDLLSLGNALVVSFLVAVVLCFVFLLRAVRTRDTSQLVLASWFASGLSVPVLLANGYLWHNYYQWATVAPLAVGIAALMDALLTRLVPPTDSIPVPTPEHIAVGLVVLSLVWSLTFQIGAFAGTGLPGLSASPTFASPGEVEHSDLVEMGDTVADQGVDNHSEIVFVGDWGRPNSNHFGQFPDMATVLIHSGLLIKTRGPSNVQPWFESGGPRYYQNRSTVENCTVMLVKNGTTVESNLCP